MFQQRRLLKYVHVAQSMICAIRKVWVYVWSRNFEILVFILIGGGFILYLHPELATRDRYSDWLMPKRVGMATLTIVVWLIIVTLRAPKSSGPPTLEAARQTFGLWSERHFLHGSCSVCFECGTEYGLICKPLVSLKNLRKFLRQKVNLYLAMIGFDKKRRRRKPPET